MNLRKRVIQLERKTRRSDGADEHLRCIEILVVPSRGDTVDLEEQIIPCEGFSCRTVSTSLSIHRPRLCARGSRRPSTR
jgi:hypothetical protein